MGGTPTICAKREAKADRAKFAGERNERPQPLCVGMHDAKRTPNFWVREASPPATPSFADLGGMIVQHLDKHDREETIEHKRTARPIFKRFVAQRRQECAQPGRENFITPHTDNGQHQSRDKIAIGGFEFEVSRHEPCDLSRVRGREK
jgi:hypothetical protein